MPAAWVGAAAAIVGAGASIYSANKSADAMDNATEAQKSIQQQQLDLAHEQYNRYKSTYEPIEDQYVNEAKNYGSEANRQKAATDAAGDVTASYSNLRQQLNSTPGLDPSSTQYANLMTKLGVQQAGQTAAAETGARKNVDAQGAARMQDAVSLGKGLSSNASATLAGASASASALGQLGIAQGNIASQQASGIGRAIGGLSSNTDFTNGIKNWFTSTPSLDGTSVTPVTNSELDTIPATTMNNDMLATLPGGV
jgi:hypothetical protein